MCPRCGHPVGWRMADGRFRCGACDGRTSVTAGTIFDRTRTPLTVWFMACWLFATQKDGVSAQSLQRALEIGSYQTAWAMLHRLRSVLVRPGRDRLTGTVEVDETFIGGEEPGLRGGRQKGKKSLVGVAVEVKRAEGVRALPDGDPRRRLGGLAAPVRHRSRRAGHGGDHRRLAGLQRHRGPRLRPSTGAASAPHGAAARTPTGSSRASTGSRHSPSGGCSAPTKARSTRRTCRATSTSSCSASTGAPPAAAAWCSTGSSSSPSPTSQCATATSSSTRTPSEPASRGCRLGPPAVPRAAPGHPPLASG